MTGDLRFLDAREKDRTKNFSVFYATPLRGFLNESNTGKNLSVSCVVLEEPGNLDPLDDSFC